jgi:hypothetical protein
MTPTKCPTRTGFKISLEADRSHFLLKCKVGLELPRAILGRVSVDIALMLAQALSQIVSKANVEMARDRE